jgi:hypothetical protein
MRAQRLLYFLNRTWQLRSRSAPTGQLQPNAFPYRPFRLLLEWNAGLEKVRSQSMQIVHVLQLREFSRNAYHICEKLAFSADDAMICIMKLRSHIVHSFSIPSPTCRRYACAQETG